MRFAPFNTGQRSLKAGNQKYEIENRIRFPCSIVQSFSPFLALLRQSSNPPPALPHPSSRPGGLLQPQSATTFSGPCGGRDSEQQQQSQYRTPTSIQNSNLNHDPGLISTTIRNSDYDLDSHLRLRMPRKNSEEEKEEEEEEEGLEHE